MEIKLFTRLNLTRILVVFILFAASCAAVRHKGKHARAVIASTKPGVPGGGTIDFWQKGNEVEMKLNLSFPAKAGQLVAVHIHEHGDCGNEGNNAHGHWNPTNSKHGKWGSAEFHLGDIGNVQLDQSGKGSLTMKTDKWSVGTGQANDVAGRGLIVHEGTDDYVTQPTGNAGARMGCGVIQLTN